MFLTRYKPSGRFSISAGYATRKQEEEQRLLDEQVAAEKEFEKSMDRVGSQFKEKMILLLQNARARIIAEATEFEDAERQLQKASDRFLAARNAVERRKASSKW